MQTSWDNYAKVLAPDQRKDESMWQGLIPSESSSSNISHTTNANISCTQKWSVKYVQEKKMNIAQELHKVAISFTTTKAKLGPTWHHLR